MSNTALATLDQHELSVGELTKQVNKIQEVMETVMKLDVHYGVIPGTKENTLYKAGAEKLNLVFRLSPTFDLEVIELDEPGHREYRFVCTLTHLPTGLIFGEGYGSCSTMESKYLYRTGEVVETGKPVPQEYWNERDIELIGGKGHAVKKIDGQWQIVKQGEKVKHTNPADNYNTCLKMGKKRAAIDATLSATAASDIFKQDLIEEGMLNEAVITDVPPKSSKQTKQQKTTKKPKPKNPEEDTNGIDALDIVAEFDELNGKKNASDELNNKINSWLDGDKKNIKQGLALLQAYKDSPDIG